MGTKNIWQSLAQNCGPFMRHIKKTFILLLTLAFLLSAVAYVSDFSFETVAFSQTWLTKIMNRTNYKIINSTSADNTQKDLLAPLPNQQIQPRGTTVAQTTDLPIYHHVAHPRNYHFTLDEPDKCSQWDPFLVLMVPVAPHEADARNAIRSTWGNESSVQGKAVLTLFLVGLTGGAEAQQQLKKKKNFRARVWLWAGDTCCFTDGGSCSLAQTSIERLFWIFVLKCWTWLSKRQERETQKHASQTRFRGVHLVSPRLICASSRQMSYNKSFLFFLLVPGTALLLYLCYSPMTSGQDKKEPQLYPLPKRQSTAAPSKDPVNEEPEMDTVQEEPGLYHVAYPQKYKFIIDQPTICEQQKPFVVIMVPVPPWDAEARSGIRRTWGGEKLIGDKVVLVLFIIGLHSGNDQETLQEKLQNESQQYQDVLQSNFLDSYKNLTIKTMMMMEWLNRSCQQASFAVKVDADVLLNMNNLIKMLVSLNPVPTNYMTGLVWYGNIVIRNPLNKFYLPYDVYPRDTYPPYPLGMCYIISLDLPQKFIQESKHIKPIFIEDAYLGICLERLGIVPTNPPNIEQFVVTPQYNRCYYSGLIAILTDNTNQMTSYWTDIHSTSNPC